MRFIQRAERRRSKEPIEEPENVGFHYPFEYLERVCPYVIASGYSIFPVAGGLDDQDPLFLEDLETFLWLQEWAEQEAKGTSGGNGDSAKGLPFNEL